MSIGLADAETIAAVSAVFHSGKDYQEFYDKHGETFEGFVGIWNLCAKMGLAFINAEHEMTVQWDGEWIDAVDSYVAAIYERADKEPPSPITEEELLQIAKDAINKALSKN